MRTVAVLPVKSFPNAKQRLSQGLESDLRQRLAEAMLRDVLAGLSATALDAVLVVTAGEAVAAVAREQGASVISDSEHGHNAAAEIGVREALRRGAQRALLVPGDCPVLDPAEIDELLSRPYRAPEVIIVPDRHGTGTNALLLTPPDVLASSFGPGSCRRHVRLAEEAEIEHEVLEVPSLAIDIDTPEDLDALAGLAERPTWTHELLARC
jgi:2-phospho-L-lactate guanylyltransferase